MQNESNWVLRRIVELDITRPGLAGSFLRSSDERRQVVAAHLARRPDLVEDAQAHLLATGTHDDILTASYDTVPKAFRALLSRAGPTPHPRRFYHYLYALLRSRHAKGTLALLAQQPRLDYARLRIMRTLPMALRTPRLVALHRDIQHARHTAALFRLMCESGADPTSLAQSLGQAQAQGDLLRGWKNAIERLSFPLHPVPTSPAYRPLTTGGELKATALRMRNCMRRYLTDVLEGIHAFAVYREDEQEVVVHLRRRESVWHLEGLHGPRNRPVPEGVRKAATRHLLGFGITSFEPARASDDKWEQLREVLCQWEFERDEDTGWA